MQARRIKIVTSHNTAPRTVRAATIAIVALAFAFLSVQKVNAQVIDHSGGFRSHDDLTANVNNPMRPPTFVGNLLRLTEGTNDNTTSVFSNVQVDATSFTTTFFFEIQPGSAPPADGLMFVIQNDPRGAMALGCGGGGLGYAADNPTGMCAQKITNSVGVKFDIFKGNDCEPSNNQTGLYVDGDSPTCPQPGTDDVNFDLTGSGIGLDSDNPPWFRCDLSYVGTTLTETITNMVTGNSVTETYTVDIPSHLGGTTGNVGFTGSTGGLNATEIVLSWIWQSPSP